MKFGPVPVGESCGALVAHGVQIDGLVLKKGDRIAAHHIETLHCAGVESIVVAALEDGDVDENVAARHLAGAVAGPGLRIERAFTGRANIFACGNGVLEVDAAAVDRLNAVDERLTLATLPPFRAVEDGEMVVSGLVLDAAIETLATAAPLRLAPYRPRRIGVDSTVLPGLKASVIAKTLRVLADRLVPTGSFITADIQVPHDTGALTGALRRLAPSQDMLIVFGASAIADRRDVIPAAIERAGGTVDHFGMPVDPGNLLLLGTLGGLPVLGAPGCARSPKENGFDWVLQRLLADVSVTGADIRRLGAGGLLMEIVSRSQPRLGDAVTATAVQREPVA